MSEQARARVAIVVSKAIDRFVDRFDFDSVSEARRLDALGQIYRIRAELPANSALIDSAFAKLDRALRQRSGPGRRASSAAGRKLARMLRALSPLALVAGATGALIASPAMAAIPVLNINDTIINPDTGATETVVELIGNYSVVTSAGNVILLAQTVGDTYSVTDNSTTPATITSYRVTGVTLTNGRVTSVDVKNLATNATSTFATVTIDTRPPLINAGTGAGSNYATPSLPGVPYRYIVAGGDGGDGSDGGGVCFGALGCIEYRPGDGGPGGDGPTVNAEIPVSWGYITTTADKDAGIVVVSKGGDGGDGGTGYGNIAPARGGNGGTGGTVSAVNHTAVTTGGVDSYAMLVQSVGGRAGSGGDCYVLCSGGGPGTPGNGGDVTGINAVDGLLTTTGAGAAGLVVQSSGGNAGTGGSSYGLYGDGGSGGYGGNGGTAHGINYGTIRTQGELAYGMLVQSIGGIGGNAGGSGGIVAFNGSGGGGGKGGTAIAELGSTSRIYTEGKSAHGLLVQSIGGGGGSSGTAAGALAFGSGDGGSGASGGTVTVTAAAGAYIETQGVGANGIYAESIGGTGGTAAGAFGAVAMGGSAGSGKTGGNVTVGSSATIVTYRKDARGIFAQSVGGGGGSAATSGGAVTLGGSGGTGANAGNVILTLGSASMISTRGAGADGAFAQSIGGGGGSGGASIGALALGGSGSVAGSGGSVTMSNAGSIFTEQQFSRGMFAQSIGGGGGSGGDSSGIVTIGGGSDVGSNGGDILIGNSGRITTQGFNSQGIIAQSIGGGGGYGGDGDGLVSIGGSGSAGSIGGTVTVSNTGIITTTGAKASAIQVQSIGGGGGEGGSTGGGLVTIGGKAGSGSLGGAVIANISGILQTEGRASHGLLAQSIGGGGGNGGSATTVSAFAGVAIGGQGGAGGNGGTVNVNLISSIQNINGVDTAVLPDVLTTGSNSRGIFAQSLGGGGGAGGFAVQTSVGAFGSASFAIGGSGNAGGDGGAVWLTGDARIQTTNDNSQGIFIQSIGGGGGAGGFSLAAALSGGTGFSGSLSVGLGGSGAGGGDGGAVHGSSGGSIVTQAKFSTGYVAQSIGGGGGAGGFNISASGAATNGFAVNAAIGRGGAGAGGGDGGTVDATYSGTILTGGIDGMGSDAAGFVAQSLGGGGGIGGFNVSGTLGMSDGGSIGGAIGLGGSGGGGGKGGTVTGRVGTVSTTGDRSTAVIIQSVGGGGGAGGFNVSGTLAASAGFTGGISVGLGGSGAGGGDGGVVTGTVTGKIQTSGNQSDGVFVQSLGGGGGSGGFNVSSNVALGGTSSVGVSVGLGGSAGTGGSGLTATGHVLNDVVTLGNQSRGVVVQSVGGGGGAGGFNVSGNLSLTTSASGSVGVGLGGSGGGGGAGGAVFADALNVATSGNDATGFIAQSVGGGGGVGGMNINLGLAFSAGQTGAIGVGLGGSGGKGGNANTVIAKVVGNSVTLGDRSSAIVAQSIGGGGGTGGFNIGGNIAASNGSATSVSVGLGGSGGAAGNAGNVALDVVGAVQTGEGTATWDRGAFSDGIVAQSVGGGGGSGGFNVNGNIAASASGGAGQVGIGIGGHGGGGGSAGTVNLTVNDGVTTNDPARIAAITQQEGSRGIVAQSVGGGGGSGGFNVGAGITISSTGSRGASVGIGGSGGSGNGAGTVIADISGLVLTSGADSTGVLAQSVGGGGGSGGFNVTGDINFGQASAGSISVGIGGSGGSGGSGGAVTLRVNDQIDMTGALPIAAQTSGDRAAGIVAQSLGGGGGSGGFNVTGSIRASGGTTGGVSIGIGGSGGTGGFSQAAEADITGRVSTQGNESDAVVVQSLGGGGGTGGFNVDGAINVSGGAGGQIGVGIGGFGGDGGHGGDATLYLNSRHSTGTIDWYSAYTTGKDSDGVIVQSLGGGGGNGGFNVTGQLSLSGSGTIGVGIGGFGGTGGAAGLATSNVIGNIGTRGLDSTGLLVQSLGGGGGNGGFNVTAGGTISSAGSGNVGVGIGGFGGSGGASKTVTSTLVGTVTTVSDGSAGVVVQSLGGGGGNGGFNSTTTLSIGTSDQVSGNVGVGIGGFGGSGGDAADAISLITGNIITRGANSQGLVVQSQGGGGGNGGFNVTANVAVSSKGTSGNLGIGIGGFGGDGGNAGAVNSTMNGDIITGAPDQNGWIVLADKSSGATIQSIGGGGGNGSFNVTGNITASFGDSPSGSVGVGIGGFGGEGGNAGQVTANQFGEIHARGDNSYGILVQSAGGGGGSGGLNVTGNLQISKSAAGGSIGVGIGGFGGGGGDGADVIADLRGHYSTDGLNAPGVVVLSQGGGGGMGGMNISGTVALSSGSTAIAAALGLGGFGGDGGNAGAIDLTRIGTTSTDRSNSNGVVAASIGGGGGVGGMNVSAGISGTNTGKAGSVALGIGGFGGGGGDGGYVTARVLDSVWATGSDAGTLFIYDLTLPLDQLLTAGIRTHYANGSSGIIIKSQGGGGGSGGVNVSAGISLAKSADSSSGGALVLGIGGFGGKGGDAGNVDAIVGKSSGTRIQVESKGDSRSAVYVGSVGGGGGDGALNISGGITTAGQVVAGLGGFGGDGGLGRNVTASVNADLFARGYKASGLTVQSVGGGGGSGGINISGGLKPLEGSQPVITFGMGGDGGAGNSSGNVTAAQDGQVWVDGYSSVGVLVQSVAGGGGYGGMDLVGNLNRSSGGSTVDGFAASIGIGGSGGTGGKAGDVSLRSTGNVFVNTVLTPTDTGMNWSKSDESGNSSGVVAQSIGGGGGVGGFNFTGVVAPNGTPLNFSMGGSGGVGGDAGTVTVRRGFNADGSINGSVINTFGIGSSGLVAQSIGGGGGSAGTNLAFTYGTSKAGETGFGGQFVIGGSGASSGNGSTVNVFHAGTIMTNGKGSDALLAQSIGRGGGNAAVNVGFAKLGSGKGDASAKSTVNGFSLALGGETGDGGSAGNVMVDHDGLIITRDAESSGIVAQSLAGGGGNVALNMGLLLGADNVLKAGIGRLGGTGGTAGMVEVKAAGQISTESDQSNGIVAQSVGGAGGKSGSVGVDGQLRTGTGSDKINNGVSVSVGLKGGSGGRSNNVTVSNSAAINTLGEESRGIVAQSIGGDGGIAGSGLTTTTGQANSLAVSVGGDGGNGAGSGKVKVGNSGVILTEGLKSDGILAQSIGGGGGVAGSATTFKAPVGGLDNKSATTMSVAVGGGGGVGAISDSVEVTNDGIIRTRNDYSIGIRAQSIGGTGGVGGAAFNVELQKAQSTNSLNVLIGGPGGDGGIAGRVDVFNHGQILTFGQGSSGISANSVGGNGGDAGAVTNLSYLNSTEGGQSHALQIAIGGGGGSGGLGGAVNVVNSSRSADKQAYIVTNGAMAHGIFAQSLGGNGGNGSSVFSLAGSKGSERSVTVGISVGGAGGDGNKGGDVTVDNSAAILTNGFGSYGILAQSIGGGGGNGGVSVSANVLTKAKDKSPAISIGGLGGAGNDGGHVTVNNSGTIFTTGDLADGIVAQSIGGGGGNAGLALGLTGDAKLLVISNVFGIMVGASGGGKSGVGGQVDVIHSGDINVSGRGSQAIVAESINGGGGHAHFDLSGISLPSLSNFLPDVSLPDLGSLNGIPNLVPGEPTNKPVNPVIVAVRVGASDASQLNSGKVNLTVTGTIAARGDYGAGSTLRSIGGGGGDVVLTGSFVKPDASIQEAYSAQAIYAVGLGSKDSQDNNGLDNISTQNGAIVTAGIGANGALVQSIGGGGGSALVNLEAEDPTMIDSIRLGLGAVRSSNSDGGQVIRNQVGAIVTTKAMAHGAVIQSIGGGGGTAIAHFGIVAPPVVPAAARTITAAATTAAVPNLNPPAIVSLGADGGAGNDGNSIAVNFQGGFSTSGNQANALIVQSIGAGGGEVTLDGIDQATILLGGHNGAEGSGGAISVGNNGQLLALGNYTNSVLLQSIGGGGGAVFGDFVNTGLTLHNDNTGNGGGIHFTQLGDVAALGDKSNAIIAQSLGGGGGFIQDGFAGVAGGTGSGGAIDLDINGSIIAWGLDSTAVLAQSLGSLGGGNITLLSSGSVRGGNGTGIGVSFDGGNNNLIDTAGTLSAMSGLAIKATSGNDRVENRGTVVGNALLGEGTNLIHNALGATFVTINTLDLQDGGGSGAFANDGALEMGLRAPRFPINLGGGATFAVPVYTDPKSALLYGTTVISQVALDGEFRQSSTGETWYDVAFGPYASDRINATGNAIVDGTAHITLTWLQDNRPVTLIATGGTGIDNGLEAPDTIALDYAILAGKQGIQLTFSSDFGKSFLNHNEQQLGHHMDSALKVGGAAGIGRLMALLGNLTTGQEDYYRAIFDELDPESLLAPTIEHLDSARGFSKQVVGCDPDDTARNRCLWGGWQYHSLERKRDGDTAYSIKLDGSAQLRMGGAIALGNGWSIGGAFGYDGIGSVHFDFDRATGSDGAAIHIGLGGKKRFGRDGSGSIGLNLSAGWQQIDMTRRQNIFGATTGRAEVQTRYLGINANAGYSFGSGPVFIRPNLDLSAIRLGIDGFSEQGLEGLGMRVDQTSHWYLSAEPKLTIGANTGNFRMSVSGGMHFSNQDQFSAPMRFVGADPASDPATIRTMVDDQSLVLGAELGTKATDRLSLSLGYQGYFGKRIDSHALRLNLKWAF